jgi:hypothetical protein
MANFRHSKAVYSHLEKVLENEAAEIKEIRVVMNKWR